MTSIRDMAVVDRYQNLCLWGHFTFVHTKECPLRDCKKLIHVYEHGGEMYGMHVSSGTFDCVDHFVDLKDGKAYHPCVFYSKDDVRSRCAGLVQRLDDLRTEALELEEVERWVRMRKEDLSNARRKVNETLDVCMG